LILPLNYCNTFRSSVYTTVFGPPASDKLGNVDVFIENEGAGRGLSADGSGPAPGPDVLLQGLPWCRHFLLAFPFPKTAATAAHILAKAVVADRDPAILGHFLENGFARMPLLKHPLDLWPDAYVFDTAIIFGPLRTGCTVHIFNKLLFCWRKIGLFFCRFLTIRRRIMAADGSAPNQTAAAAMMGSAIGTTFFLTFVLEINARHMKAIHATLIRVKFFCRTGDGFF
jgi:hypothetical protein